MENNDPQFNPYSEWFHIADDQVPPDHYALLGLTKFETDLATIDQAAKDRSAYLHQLAAGPQRKIVQRLMNEVAIARRTLINPDSRLSYDESLRQPQPQPNESPSPASPSPASPSPVSTSPEPTAFQSEPASTVGKETTKSKPKVTKKRARKKKNSMPIGLLLLSASLSVLVVVMAWMYFKKSGGRKAAEPMPLRKSARTR